MSSETNWIEKHRPQSFGEIQGNTSAIEEIEEWATEWEEGGAPRLLVGEPGTGKTSTAYVTADECDLDLNEVDASTARKTADVRRLAGEIRAGDQLVLLDEVDSWHHAVDLRPLANELKDPSNPVMMTANEEHEVPYALKEPAEVHEFKLSKASRRAKIREISKREGIDLDDRALKKLVERPDLRSAINDLQIHAKMKVPIGDDKRDWDTSEFELMDRMIIEGKTDSGDVDPPSLIHWLDQNLPKEFRGVELAFALDTLARADCHLPRKEGDDYYGWKYAAVVAECVPTLRRTDPYRGWIRWEFPGWWKSSTQSPDAEEDGEARLYRELSAFGEPETGITGGYPYFRNVLLPLLHTQSESERLQFAVDHSLTEEAAAALDVDTDGYEAESPEGGEGLPVSTEDATEADW